MTFKGHKIEFDDDLALADLMTEAAASCGKHADRLYAFIVERRPDAYLGRLRKVCRDAIHSYTGKWPADPPAPTVNDPVVPAAASAGAQPEHTAEPSPEGLRTDYGFNDNVDGRCSKCGHVFTDGDWPFCPHGKSVQTNTFAAYFDIGLGIQVDNLGDRRKAMRGEIDNDSGEKRGQLDYRDKPSKGELSARRDRAEQQARQQHGGPRR